jgi:hypothetical protein
VRGVENVGHIVLSKAIEQVLVLERVCMSHMVEELAIQKTHSQLHCLLSVAIELIDVLYHPIHGLRSDEAQLVRRQQVPSIDDRDTATKLLGDVGQCRWRCQIH